MRSSALAGLTAVAVLALSACSESDPATTPDESNGSLRVAITTPPPGGWDPTAWSWDAYTPMQEAAYDSLIHSTDSGLEPGLAEEWAWESQTEFSLTIREGLEFVDGEPLTADVVQANLERFRDSTNRFAAQLSTISGFEVVSDTELLIRFSAPQPDLERILTQNAGLMVSPAAIEDPSLLATSPRGISPYVLDETGTTEGVTYLFQRNPDYWNVDSLPYSELTFEIQADRQASFNALRSGQIDLMWGTAENVDAAKAAGLGVYEAPSLVLAGVLTDFDGSVVPALADVRVRQALNYAVDRQALTENLIPGTPATQIFVETHGAFVPELDESYAYDPERARELLAEAGFADGFVLPMTTTTDLATVASALAASLGEIGVEVEVETLPLADFVSKVNSGGAPFALARVNSAGDFTDLQAFFSPTGARNPRHHEFPEIAPLLEEALQQGEDERVATYQEIGRIASELATTVPVLRETAFFFHDDSVDQMSTPVGQFWPSIRSFTP